MASIVLQNKDPAIAEAGKIASMYWMGRVNGATPTLNLGTALAAQVRTMDGANLQPEAQRCDAEMKARGGQMQAAGRALQAQAAKQGK